MIMAQAPSGVEDQIAEYQSLQTQLQFMMFQRQQYKMQLDDAEAALRELTGASGEVYKNVGLIMIKSTKEDAQKDINEKKEMITVRVSSLVKQEEKLRERLEELKGSLETALKKKL
ncbi:Prefoldin subunit beta [Candidatus Burarchaeum australiense]|nr:Prefoldin subunit beta [Candidatus Burarchaeum australiense]